MRIAITGSSGLIGSTLVAGLSQAGHAITRVVRKQSPSAANDVPQVLWDPAGGQIDAAGFEGHDAVIHLAGANIADARWTDEFKRHIRESRVQGTAVLSEALAQLARPPRVLLSASAVGYYGSRSPDERVDESSPPGDSFLARVCDEWEQAAAPARRAGIRVVPMRFGTVLAPHGGALAKMLPVFRRGLGGKVGSGRQMMSWIAMDDIVPAVLHVLSRDDFDGPVNFVSPNPVSNAQFTRALGHALGRPTLIGMPALAARLLFGEMADELLLAGAAVVPKRLLDSGYTFRSPDLEPALVRMLRGSST